LDSGVYPGWTVPIDYDPLLAKLVAYSPDRGLAIARMLRALAEYQVDGIETNLAFFRAILDDAEFRAGRLHTGFIDEFMRRRIGKHAADSEMEAVAAIAADAYTSAHQATAAPPGPAAVSRWTRERLR
jgi:acetyl-CoA carboxylase biotin carboxylase subunit